MDECEQEVGGIGGQFGSPGRVRHIVPGRFADMGRYAVELVADQPGGLGRPGQRAADDGFRRRRARSRGT
ncbi:hypothetical protein IEJ02_02730 [Streptomyces sp. 5-10]|nr:hypothetical protein [Streptomyces sp. 5-10]